MRKSFDQLYGQALERKGPDKLEERMPAAKSAKELAAIPDDRWLSMMARRVFQAGFVYRVIEAKWPGFEEAFNGFDVGWVARLDEGALADLGQDTRIVRNLQKIRATVANARFIEEVAAEHGSFARFIAGWPEDDVIGLWELLKKRGARLGGDTGPRLLRSMGKDTFILTRDVVANLAAQGIVDKKPTSRKALAAAQEAFNAWRAESGRGLGEISIVLACGIDG